MKVINEYFLIEERSTSILQEVRAGITCFLTMSYILLVNAQVLNQIVGISPTEVVIGTALSSGVGTLITGLFGNLPFGTAPGIGLSAYLAYGLILENGLTISEAFTSCFISGILLCIFSVSGVTHFIMDYIPKAVKFSTIVGMGLQICLAGMTSVKLVVPNEHSLVAIGPIFTDIHILLTCIGIILIGSLIYHNIKGSILLGVILISILTWSIDNSFPVEYIKYPSIDTKITDLINLNHYDISKMTPAILAFLFIGIVDVSGVVFGMSRLAGIIKPNDEIPGSIFAFLGCGIGTLVGACTCSSPLIVYVESAAGIKDGGKTGLSAIVISMLFFLSVFFAPVFSQVPSCATAPVSVLIGVMMMSHAEDIDWEDMSEAIPSFLTLIVMPFTFSITNGIMFGLVSSFCFYITTGKAYVDFIEYYYVSHKYNKIHDKPNFSVSSQSTEHQHHPVLDTFTSYHQVDPIEVETGLH